MPTPSRLTVAIAQLGLKLWDQCAPENQTAIRDRIEANDHSNGFAEAIRVHILNLPTTLAYRWVSQNPHELTNVFPTKGITPFDSSPQKIFKHIQGDKLLKEHYNELRVALEQALEVAEQAEESWARAPWARQASRETKELLLQIARARIQTARRTKPILGHCKTN